MKVRLILHHFDGDFVLFEGAAAHCPPIPRSGEEIVHEERRVRVEGISYLFRANCLEVGLLA